MLPLTGIKVVDLTRVVAGPVCTLNLAEMGAEVIKIEAPGKGDDTRATPPFINGESTWFMMMNCNKKSITLDLKSQEGKEVVWRLIDQADVIVQNFRPGVANRLGFSYEAVSARNPQMIYCSISGYGVADERGAYDPVIQGESGFMSVTGDPNGEPMKVAVPICDLVSALYAVQGILYSLMLREKTGKGRHIDISMLSAMISLFHLPGSKYLGTGKNPPRMGNMHLAFAPYKLFSTSDGYIDIACGNDKLYHNFCDALGLSQLKDDPRFLKNKDRMTNRAELSKIVEPVLLKKSTAEWCAILEKDGVPSGPIRTTVDIFTDPDLQQKGDVINMEHCKAGKIQIVGNPVRMTDVSVAYSPAPVLGANSEEILKGLGYSAEQISQMREQGIM